MNAIPERDKAGGKCFWKGMERELRRKMAAPRRFLGNGPDDQERALTPAVSRACLRASFLRTLQATVKLTSAVSPQETG